jgi:hypothetical protein
MSYRSQGCAGLEGVNGQARNGLLVTDCSIMERIIMLLCTRVEW